MIIRVTTVEECDARDDDSSNADWSTKKNSPQLLTIHY